MAAGRGDAASSPTLAFAGLATFHRLLQSGLEDLAYARRIAQLRDYYVGHAPELAGYLVNPRNGCPARDWGSACGSNS